MSAAFGTTRRLLGWSLVFVLFAYTVWVYYGVGPRPQRDPTWWEPSGFLWEHEISYDWEDEPDQGIALLAVPAVLLMAGVFAGTRSSLARALGVSFAVSAVLLAFYGLRGVVVWEFFRWRWTMVVLYTGLALGFATSAPLLTASWLRRNIWLKLLLYVPIFFVVVATIRNATGTDERLAFNFSPWPAIPVVGFEIAAYLAVGVLIGLAVAVLGYTVWDRRPGLAGISFVSALIIPFVWFRARFPFPDLAGTIADEVVLLALYGCVLLAGLTWGADRRRQLLRRALHLGLGAFLVAAPLFAGRAMADADYAFNRFVRAQVVIDALTRHWEKEQKYPDGLDQLIAGNYLDELPRPRVGFQLLYAPVGWLEPNEFFYRNVGSSYVLEFVSTEWVQCAYNPAYIDDDLEDEELEEDYDYEGEYADEEGEVWSCPDAPPELW